MSLTPWDKSDKSLPLVGPLPTQQTPTFAASPPPKPPLASRLLSAPRVLRPPAKTPRPGAQLLMERKLSKLNVPNANCGNALYNPLVKN